jgi:hypothetical protein
MRVVVYHGVFGGWGWEALDDNGDLRRESDGVFESREECENDARACGVLAPGQRAEDSLTEGVVGLAHD